MRKVVAVLSGLLFGVLILGLIRTLFAAIFVPLAVMAWFLYVPVAAVKWLVVGGQAPRSLLYFMKYPIVVFDVCVERICCGKGDKNPTAWPWHDDASVRQWRLRYLLP